MKQKTEKFIWCCFDIGNSAHALLISTVGFALYFKEFLFKGSPNGNTAWGALTSVILIFSAILSPLLASFFCGKKKRSFGLILTTMMCAIATALLGTKFGGNVAWATLIYFFSALGYYLALPIYNSYLPDISGSSRMQKLSGLGWALGYLGGIISALLCFWWGFLEYPASERPDLYRNIFFVAAYFNLALSMPMLVLSYFKDRNKSSSISEWYLVDVIKIFRSESGNSILKTLLVYWLISEIGVVVIYFFAIMLKDYAGLSESQIMMYTIGGQLIAIASTLGLGVLSDRIGGKKVLLWVVSAWTCVPILLFLMSIGLPFWIPMIVLGLIMGAYHSIIRGRIGEISTKFSNAKDKGSLFGFLEVSGRISQVVGPILMTLLTLFMPLNYGIIVMMVFPLIALIILAKDKWE